MFFQKSRHYKSWPYSIELLYAGRNSDFIFKLNLLIRNRFQKTIIYYWMRVAVCDPHLYASFCSGYVGRLRDCAVPRSRGHGPNGQRYVPILYGEQIGNHMLRVQIRLYIWPVLTLKPIFQGHPFSETTVNGMLIFVAKRSEISVNVCMGANGNPYPVRSNPP